VHAKVQLENHPSPYIAIHAHDPVHWQTWNNQVLDKARRRQQLIYVSSGYFACRWCHVMHKEIYQNRAIAAVLNQHFIAVKIDRALNPALDALLLAFVERTRGTAGWPLNVFLTPEGYPLVGFTYLPPNRFMLLAKQLQHYWQTDAKRLKQMAYEAFLTMYPPPTPPQPLTAKLIDLYLHNFLEQALFFADETTGGFGEEEKYPQVPQLTLLLTLYHQKPSSQLDQFLRLTLDNMSQLGLYDKLEGGFFHSVIDREWQQPDFEKTLYDNALLASLYLKAATVLQEPRYAQIAHETLDFVLHELVTPEGSFIAGLSATHQTGGENRYYLWETAELEKLLNEKELFIAQKGWNMQGPSVFPQGGYLPLYRCSINKLAEQLNINKTAVITLLESTRNKLRKARAQRFPLHDDAKKLAGWNGLMLSTLAQAIQYRDEQRYRMAGKRLRDYLSKRLWKGNRLWRAAGPQGPVGEVSLEDYAYVAQGLLDWHAVSQEEEDLKRAKQLVHFAWQTFYDQGWYLSEHETLPMAPSTRLIIEEDLPSPAAILIDLKLRLNEIDDHIHSALALGQADIMEMPFLHPTHIHMTQKIQKQIPY
jgi:hypothetical protein